MDALSARPDEDFIASASVDTVNDKPSACTSSSLSNPIACRYGTAGMTKTPVAAVMMPVVAPTVGPSHLSWRLLQRRGRMLEP